MEEPVEKVPESSEVAAQPQTNGTEIAENVEWEKLLCGSQLLAGICPNKVLMLFQVT